MIKQKQRRFFLSFGVFTFLGFFIISVQSVFACQWSVVQWGGTLSGQCKSTCLSLPKEESALGGPAGCGENESCCIPNPNLNQSCSESATGSSRRGTCKASSDCLGASEGVPGNPCSLTGLVCCVAKGTGGGGVCSGSYSSGRPASGTCTVGASSCSGGKIFVGTCTGGLCCADPENSGGGSGGGTGGGGSGGSGGGTGGGGIGGGSGESGGGSTCSGDGMIQIGPTVVPGGVCLPKTKISVLVVRLLQWLLYIFGFLSVLAFVISGGMYLTSGGNDSMIDRAKTYMTWSIVGVIVALSGLIIVNAINSWLQNSRHYF